MIRTSLGFSSPRANAHPRAAFRAASLSGARARSTRMIGCRTEPDHDEAFRHTVHHPQPGQPARGAAGHAPSNLPAAARQAVIRSMLKNQLLEELPAPAEHRDLGWRQDDEGAWIALRITSRRPACHRRRARRTERLGTEPRELTEERGRGAGPAAGGAGRRERGRGGAGRGRPTASGATAPHGPARGRRGNGGGWEAQDGLEAALTALKAALGGRAPARTPGAPRKAREGTKQEAVLNCCAGRRARPSPR
jgi:hypothetical protein